MKIGNLIASIVISLWGSAILVSSVLRDTPDSGGAAGAGRSAALVAAVVMVGLGVRGILIELRRRSGATA